MLMKLLAVFIGGGLGAAMRFGLGAWLMGLAERRGVAWFPIGTLGVNVLGCLLIGVAAAWLTEGEAGKSVLRLLLVVGVLGGFTTFSSFALEAWKLVQDGRLGWALAYVMLSNALGIGACVVGWVTSGFLGFSDAPVSHE